MNHGPGFDLGVNHTSNHRNRNRFQRETHELARQHTQTTYNDRYLRCRIDRGPPSLLMMPEISKTSTRRSRRCGAKE